jgi:uracil-DNA glycosylase
MPSTEAGETTGIVNLGRDVANCRRCHSWTNATQTFFGEGPSKAEEVIVGEQPGDKEDLSGWLFVGAGSASRWQPRQRALSGKATPVNAARGRLIKLDDEEHALDTVHPSFLLRVPDATARALEFSRFAADLSLIRREVPSANL